MGVRRISGPVAEPVTVQEAKDHLNFSSDAKDELIAGYISAARSLIENSCHIIVAEAEFEAAFSGFPEYAIEIGQFPLLDVQSVKYDDGDGVEVALSPSDYYVDSSGRFGTINPVVSWPSARERVNSMRVRFTAGYSVQSGEEANIPAWVRHAILLLVAHFFHNREAVSDGDMKELPMAVEALIGPHRVPVLA